MSTPLLSLLPAQLWLAQLNPDCLPSPPLLRTSHFLNWFSLIFHTFLWRKQIQEGCTAQATERAGFQEAPACVEGCAFIWPRSRQVISLFTLPCCSSLWPGHDWLPRTTPFPNASIDRERAHRVLVSLFFYSEQEEGETFSQPGIHFQNQQDFSFSATNSKADL